MIFGKRVDGLIFSILSQTIRWLTFAIKKPISFLDFRKTVSPFVFFWSNNDNIQGWLRCNQIFPDQGYKKIASLAKNKELVVSQDRFMTTNNLRLSVPLLDENIIKFSSVSSWKIAVRLWKRCLFRKLRPLWRQMKYGCRRALRYIKALTTASRLSLDSIKPRTSTWMLY